MFEALSYRWLVLAQAKLWEQRFPVFETLSYMGPVLAQAKLREQRRRRTFEEPEKQIIPYRGQFRHKHL